MRLSDEDILAGYDRVSSLYPFIPPLSLWRAWECAAYARYRLPEPVLDIGCGDGRFFRMLWPHIRQVVGVEVDPAVAEQAVASGVYERVLRTPANRIPAGETGYASAFANCSLEHMDDLDGVLRSVYRALAPGGRFLCSVVTDRFVAWPPLPALIATVAGAELARQLGTEYLSYHHLVSPLTEHAWCQRLEAAGFGVREHVPILPEATARLFLTLDQLGSSSRSSSAAIPDSLPPSVRSCVESSRWKWITTRRVAQSFSPRSPERDDDRLGGVPAPPGLRRGGTQPD
jgi:SAM-dependent methyltransferase